MRVVRTERGPGGIVWDVYEDGQRGVNPWVSSMDAIERMAAETDMSDGREPTPPTRRECDSNHAAANRTFSRIDRWMDTHVTEHRIERAERQTQTRWVIGLLVTIVGLVAALGGLTIVGGG